MVINMILVLTLVNMSMALVDLVITKNMVYDPGRHDGLINHGHNNYGLHDYGHHDHGYES